MSTRAALLVAETGGHLQQITQLEPRLSPRFRHVTYVTSPSAQSRSLMDGRRVRYGAKVPPRDWLTAMQTMWAARRVLGEERVTDVVSTGSAIAVPYLVTARLLGLNAHYIESAARTTSPSLSGRILQRVPGVNLYCQYPNWAGGPWRYAGSVLDGYRSEVKAPTPLPARRVVVTLGTMAQYPFDRAVEAVLRVLPDVAAPDCEVFWQVGGARSEHLLGEVHDTVSTASLRKAIESSDLVIAHAGTGSCLAILDTGRVPVLLPRLQSHGEHVDDHQLLIAKVLCDRGLAVSADPDDLTPAMVHEAMRQRVRLDDEPGMFTLRDAPRPVRRVRAQLAHSPNNGSTSDVDSESPR